MKNKMARFRKILISGVLIAGLLAGCGSASSDSATDSQTETGSDTASDTTGGTVTYGLASGWDSLQPGNWVTTGFYGTIVWSQIYDKLVNVSSDGYSAAGATSWTQSDDKTVMTFKLDENAKFSDGEPITAEDWVFSAKLLSDPDFGANDYTKLNVLFAGTDDSGLIDDSQDFGVEAIDDYTLQITFKEAMTFDSFFSSYVYYLFVLPEHSFEGMTGAEIAADTDFWDDPVCSGAWTVEDQVVNSTLTLVPNEYYRGGVAKLDELIYTVMDSSNFASALMSGTIDYSYPSLTDDEYTALQDVDGVSVEQSENPGELWFLAINNELVDDANVRKAINMAVNKDLIASQLFSGSAIPVESVELYGTSNYNDSLTTNYDPDAAKALLDEAGYDYDTVFTIATPSGVRADIATIIEQNLEAIGMNVEVTTMDIGTMYSEMHDGNYFACMGGGSPNMDPLYFQSNLETSNPATSIIKTTDDTFHELAQEISQATTDEEKNEKVMEYTQYMYDTQVVVPVVEVYEHYGYSSRLQGIDPDLSAYMNDNTSEWYVTE